MWVYSRGLKTHPEGRLQMLSAFMEKMQLSIFTDCGLRVRKLRIQSQRAELRPRCRIFEISLEDLMALKDDGAVVDEQESDVGDFVVRMFQ
eukprot:g25086.t1